MGLLSKIGKLLGVVVLSVVLGFAGMVSVDIAMMDTPNVDVNKVQVITASDTVEKYLGKYKDVIPPGDYPGYKNHIFRVLTYTNIFLEGSEHHRRIIELALVYHDIGLWSDGVLNYLDPSFARAKEDLKGELSEDDLELVHDIIIYHHKCTPYTSETTGQMDSNKVKIVEAVRKADWIDATQNVLKKGMPGAVIEKVNQKLPASGFYNTLLDMGPRIHGNDPVTIVRELGKILYL